MKSASRVFYIGMITTDAYAAAMGEKTYAGAAASKMVQVVRSLRSVGQRALIVSLPFVGPSARAASYGALLTTGDGVPIVFLATLRSKYLRKLVAPLLLAAFFLRQGTRRDKVVLYNHAIEYVPALLVLRAKGVRLIQDIEDAPTASETGLRGFLNRLSFAITFWLTSPRKMVVADHVARTLGLQDYVVVRGVACRNGFDNLKNAQRWRDLQDGSDLKVHFGGTLIRETGVDLFCETVELLTKNDHRLPRRVSFIVSGVGEIDKIGALQARIQGSAKIRVELFPALSKADYVSLIGSCHASLSLKRPEGSLSSTTFPSKVIEITASALALVSTKFGDVASLFDQDSAFFLSTYLAAELAEIIVSMTNSPEQVEKIARCGYDVCHRTFSPTAVGQQMIRLL